MADKGLATEFKDFITTGDLMAIAVAFIMGAAIKDLVTSFIDNIFSGILALFAGDKTDFSQVTMIDGKIKIGAFINSMIAFVVLAFAVFMIVKAYKQLVRRKDETVIGPSDNELLIEIRDLLKSR